MIKIETTADLVQLEGSIIRKMEMLSNPVRIRMEIDGPDEMRYEILLSPSFATTTTPVSITVNTAIILNVRKQD